jgi:malonyl-CoA O-methyltransferase
VIRRLFQSSPKLLDPFEAYQLWAETYDNRDESALLHADNQTVYPLLQRADLPGKRILDAGCGTGRYLELLREFRPSLLAGIDLSPSMLTVAKSKPSGSGRDVLAATIDSVPFADGSFDFILSTLALDHLPDLAAAVRELSRVLRSQGSMIISLFHPDCAKRGWQRTFRAADQGRLYAVKYYSRDTAEYISEFDVCGLHVEQVVEPAIDESLKPFYERASRTDLFDQFKGASVLLVFRLRKS